MGSTRGTGLPDPIAIAVTKIDAPGAALAMRRPGQALDPQSHQPLRGNPTISRSNLASELFSSKLRRLIIETVIPGSCTSWPSRQGLAGHYSELSIPVAIVAGLGDKIVDCDRQAGRLDAELPQSTLRKVPDAGHMTHYIVPEQVADVIRDVARAALAGGRDGVTDVA